MNRFSRVAIALVGMAGLAVAQPKADPKAPVADKTPTADQKKPDSKAGGAADMKGPPPELAAVAKAASGTWTCKGQALDRTMKMTDMTAIMKVKLDVDSWWLHGSFESKMGKEAFHFESFTTMDPTSKKFRRVMVETGGVWSTGESAGMKDNKVDWEMVTHSAMGDAMFKDHEDLSDPKVGVKRWGEISMDNGKTWTKVYEMACKK